MAQSIEDQINAALIKLMSFWGFWGRLIARIQVSPNDVYETAATDGESNIWVNPEWFGSMSIAEKVIVLCHEIQHIVYKQIRGVPQCVDPKLWNIAEDCSINDAIISRLVEKPQAGLGPESFSKSSKLMQGCVPVKHTIRFPATPPIVIHDVDAKSTHQIYNELYREMSDNNGARSNGNTIDDHSLLDQLAEQLQDQNNGNQSAEEQRRRARVKRDWENAVIHTVMEMEARNNKGEIPHGMEMLVKDIKEPHISWKDKLRSSISSVLITNTSYRVFSKRAITLGNPLPGFIREGVNVAVHIDTSGSTSSYLGMFLGELKGILSSFPSVQCTLIQCDCAITDVRDLEMDTSMEDIKMKGFGGTSHKPVIDYVNQMPLAPEVLISLTDGESDIDSTYPTLRNGVKSIFVVPPQNRDTISPKFGEILIMED